MILTKLKLHNFGVYIGCQEFDLSPGTGKQNVIIVGALNGSGKTTLLTAIQLVLYGALSPNVKVKNGSYEEFLRSKINNSTNANQGASVQLEFMVFEDDGEQKYLVQRFWKENARGKVQEELKIYINGAFNKFLTENWAEHIEMLLPIRIMPLFFFDGEKVEELASEENASEILSSAVKGLLGLDLVDQLTSDLGVFSLKKKRSLASKEELAEIDSTQNTFDGLKIERKNLIQERGALVANLERQKSKYQKAISEYSVQGGELFEKREELKLKRSEGISRFSEQAEEIANISEDVAPLMLVKELLDEVTIQSDIEEVSEKAEAVLELLSIHDRKTIEKLKGLGVEHSQIDGLADYLASERQTHEEASNQERYLVLSKNGCGQLHALNKFVLAITAKDIKNGIKTNEELADGIDQFEKLLLAVPESDAIMPYMEAVEKKEKEVAELEEKIRFVDIRIHELDTKIVSTGRELRLHMSKGVDAQLEAEDANRFLKHSEKVKETLTAFKQKVLQKKLHQLESSILECFGELTRKSELISNLTIDPETFEIRLKGGDWSDIQASDLSAGERQLLATSILWGLSRASQRKIPAIIDTPLGRLDSSHRGTLCGNYFPKASHQVILLSTDEEVDERYLKILQPSVNKTYRVEFDPEKGGSEVSDGYLF
jgi:DNA sulfur modification protein DndD